jgi:ABC-2 type transport system permease protein
MNSAMGNIWCITKRELSGYFNSPVAYVFIVIFLLFANFFSFMLGGFFERGQANLEAFFTWHPWLFMVFVPAVGMRLWAEERRLGTLELLLTMPITPWQAITGKFIASWLFLGLALLLTFPIVFTVNFLGAPDNGVILAGYVGSFLMAGSFLAITCATSALTRSQVVSFIISVVICFALVLAGFAPAVEFMRSVAQLGDKLVDLVASFSVMTHFMNFQKGVLVIGDLVFFLSVIVFSLFTTAVILRHLRTT